MTELPPRWWINPTPEIEAFLARKRHEGLVEHIVTHLARGKRLLAKWEANPDKAAAARRLRLDARAAWIAKKAK